MAVSSEVAVDSQQPVIRRLYGCGDGASHPADLAAPSRHNDAFLVSPLRLALGKCGWGVVLLTAAVGARRQAAGTHLPKRDDA